MAAARFPCPSCSAGMEFSPAEGKLVCPYCAARQDVPEDAKAAVRELPFAEYENAAHGQLSTRAVEVTCATCGASVQFEPPEVAGACPFCAASLVVQPKAADPLIAPHGIRPFSVTRDRANAAIRDWLGALWFAPGGLKKLARHDTIQGVYLPFWTFDAATATDYQGERGDHYWVTESYTTTENGQTVQRTRQVQRTRWSPAWGTVQVDFDDVLVPATRAVRQDRLNRLDPWGPEAIRPYEPAYLAGFKAQRYQVDLPQGLESAKEIMSGRIVQACHSDIGGDEQRVHHMDTTYSAVTFKHLLLPVWIGAYRFQSKVYQVLINGVTAEVQGERPYSAPKIALAVIIGLILLFILIRIAGSGN